MKWIKGVITISIMVLIGGCGNPSVSEELYVDTLKVMSEIDYSVRSDEDLYDENKKLFDKYEETYSEGLNSREKELFEKMNEVYNLYETYYGDGPLLASDSLKENDYEESFRELYDITSEIKEEQNL
ncbi:hypothetical protein ACTHQ4_02425 [Alkalicoccobacillus gibsonii]|uniref:hypothetical protein n=1 Tax=Alkalicoccobacillus gibsonii TaxID=79881 RepID=UPI003F7B70F2